MDGIINIDKPVGISSFGVVQRLKRLTGQKKIGHVGTLDPLAGGVLPLFLGKMTKLVPLFNREDKTYDVTVRLGAFSSTQDEEGEKTEVPLTPECNAKRISEVLKEFEGEIEQLPPMLSAVRFKGRRLYSYAREGVEVERQVRSVTIHAIRDVQFHPPRLRFSVCCSKGTYIRVLAEDLGKRLGTGAYLACLTRTKCGKFFTLDKAVKLDQIEKLDKIEIERLFIDPKSLLPDWHVVNAAGDCERDVGNGRQVRISAKSVLISQKNRNSVRALAVNRNNRLIAIGNLEFSQDSQYRFQPSKVLV